MARFCIKNGLIDWSASPNAVDFDVTVDRPFFRRVITSGALRQIVHLHSLHIKGSVHGMKANLAGASLANDARQLIAAKLKEPGADVWKSVIATMGS